MIPSQVMKREFPEPITIRELCEIDEDEKFTIFDYTKRYDGVKNFEGSNLEYRIPKHQRKPEWNTTQKTELIDTIFKGFPIGSIILSERIEEDVKYYDIEDGQTRLSNIQGYFMNKYPLMGTYYKDLKNGEKNRFLDYKIPKIVLQKCNGVSDSEHDDNIHETFERLQGGKALADKDKIMNRVDRPIVKFVIDDIISKYMDYGEDILGVKKFNELNNRKVLPDMIGIVCGLCFKDEKCFDKGYFTAHKDNHNIVKDEELDNIQKSLVLDFIDWYYDMIKSCNTDIKVNYSKFNKVLGLCVFDYIDKSTSLEYKKDMWIDIINIMKSSYFMDTIWNGLKKGDQRNCTKSGISKRLKRIQEFYNDKEGVSKEYGIKYKD
jgi:hypothetical protein